MLSAAEQRDGRAAADSSVVALAGAKVDAAVHGQIRHPTATIGGALRFAGPHGGKTGD